MTERMARQWVLASRPPGEPSEENFALREVPIPTPGDGELLIRALYLSLDPYMRGRMRDVQSYAPAAKIGEAMTGGGVGEVAISTHPDFRPGQIVEGPLGWQTHAVSDGTGLRTVDPTLAPISTALGVLGMPGMTAYFGLLEIGRPRQGETVVVSAAAGAVGALVGQIAKLHGCRAVGIAGSDAKCGYVRDELGFDAAVNYKTTDVKAALARACPDGVDVYFDNVGGSILDAVLAQITRRARIVICGMISEYSLERPELAPRPTRPLLVNRARMEGFLVFDFAHRYPEGVTQMAGWITEGRIQYREDVVDGFENMPRAFLRLFRGENFGKQLVKVGEPAR